MPESTKDTMYGVAPYFQSKGEEYVSASMRTHFIKLLKAQKQHLTHSVNSTVAQDDAARFADPADHASQEEDFALELRKRDRERKLLKSIEMCLGKVSAEEYGWCNSCGIEIGLRRLEAQPTADLCFDCNEIAEKKERVYVKVSKEVFLHCI